MLLFFRVVQGLGAVDSNLPHNPFLLMRFRRKNAAKRSPSTGLPRSWLLSPAQLWRMDYGQFRLALVLLYQHPSRHSFPDTDQPLY